MLANIGRGMNGAAYSPETVEKKMFDLLRASKTPILTNIAVGIPQSAQGVEILPFPVPDLFAGAPVMISGKCGRPAPHDRGPGARRGRRGVAAEHPRGDGPAEQRDGHPPGQGVCEAAHRPHDGARG